MVPLAKALTAANHDRIVWGSDWPHPGPAAKTAVEVNTPIPVDDGRVLNLLAEWEPNPAIRQKILVTNPARLYGF